MSRYPNKRMMFRNGGRFAKAPTLEQMGFDVNKTERRCDACGYVWFPVLVSGECPKCGAISSKPITERGVYE